jgi:hypothetical protein
LSAVIGRRAKGDLRAGEERLHRFGKHMRIVMPHQFERIRLIARRDQRQRRIAIERPHDVAHLAVDARAKRRLGETGANARGNIGGRRAAGHFAHGTVRQGDFEHRRHARAYAVCIGVRQPGALTGPFVGLRQGEHGDDQRRQNNTERIPESGHGIARARNNVLHDKRHEAAEITDADIIRH